MMDYNLKNKNVIVTGASRGLCKEIAKSYVNAGCNVVIIASSNKVVSTAKELSTKNNTVGYVQADLTDFDRIPDIVKNCLKILNNKVDVLFNGAGMIKRCPVLDVKFDDWKKVIDLNLNSVFLLSQLFGREMVKQGYGRIINMASMDSFFGSVLVPAYSASKGGLALLTKALSNELCAKGVNVNAIAIWYIKTKLTENMKEINPNQYNEITNRIPMGRWGNPKDLCGISLFLSSKESNYITGAVIPVDGGFLSK